MNMTKKQWGMIIAGAVIVFLVYWFFFRKKKETKESGYKSLGKTTNELGSSTPVGRIKPWGGKIENGRKMCFDDVSGNYVDCGPAPVKSTK